MRDHLSHSQISMLLRCSEEYRFVYVEGRPRPLVPAIMLGQAYHKALEFGFKARMTDGTELSVAEIRQVTNDAWAMAIAGEEIAWNGAKPDDLRDQAATLAALYWEQVAPAVKPEAVEVRFEIEVPQVDLPFVGIIDLVDDGTLVDHKTASRSWSQTRVDKDIQAAAYLYAHWRQTGELAPGFRFDVAVKNKKPKILQLSTTRSERQLLQYERLLQAAWGQIQAGIFVPNPTAWNCSPRYCPFWRECQEGQT